MSNNILVLSSGGVDSATLLAMAVHDRGASQVHALSVLYGQKHARELNSSRALSAYYGVHHHELDLQAIFADSNSSLLSHSTETIPDGDYASQIAASGPIVSTYVPFRNGLFLSAAASVALSLDCDTVCYGAHADDAAGSAYPDCSAAFVNAMQNAISEGTGGTLRLAAPFVSLTKAEVVAIGLGLGVPYEMTWSCYEGGSQPCGRCGTCLDRIAAFQANGVTDPLQYPRN